MKITLVQHGGLAGIARPPLTLDNRNLAESDRQELQRLLEAASAATAPAPPGPVRDAMSHTITVEGGDRPVLLKQSDGAMSPEFAQLTAWLKRKA